MCFWLAQQQRKMKDGSLTDDKRDKLMIVLAVKGPAPVARGGGGTPSGAAAYGGSDEGEEPGDDGDDYGGDGGDDDDDGGDDGGDGGDDEAGEDEAGEGDE
jgi:hypothetical protein